MTARKTAKRTERSIAAGKKFRRLLDEIRAALDDPRVSDRDWYDQHIRVGFEEALKAEREWLAARAAERSIR